MPTRRTRQCNPISLRKAHSVDAGQYTGTVSEFAGFMYGQKKPTGQAAGSDALANATPSGSVGPSKQPYPAAPAGSGASWLAAGRSQGAPSVGSP
ncbi:hypothetical protein HK405_005667 [Cladochytrium tenue]|nr:hypothetical protein HK405_005667 [Cladochytrium tenue]